MPNAGQLMPGQSPPIAIITATDQRGVLWIVTPFCLVAVIVSLLIRAYVRVEFSQSYGKDDISIFGAFLIFIIQSSLVMFEVQLGVGQTISDVKSENASALQKTYYTSDLLYIITIWTAKCSVILLLSRLTAKTKKALVARIILGATIALGLIALLITALTCSLDSPWIFIGKQCAGKSGRWKAIAAFDMFTELTMFATFFFIISDIQLRREKKFTIILGFAFRLLLLPPIALRLRYVLSAIASTDPTLKLVNVVILTQVELASAIVSATIPCLRPFMVATYTTWGGRVDTVSGSGYNKRAYASGQQEDSNHSQGIAVKGFLSRRMDRSKNNTDTEHSLDIALEPIDTRRKKESQGWKETSNSSNDELNKGYPSTGPGKSHDGYNNSSRENPVEDDQESSGSQDSQRLIIRRDREWTVRYEHRSSVSGEDMELDHEHNRRL